jgi:hypothetical protein
LKAATEAIDAPSHHNIELTPNSGLVKSIECRTLVAALGAADAVVLVDVDDLPAGPFGDLPQLALLVGGGLIERRNPEIENGAFHVRNLPVAMGENLSPGM